MWKTIMSFATDFLGSSSVGIYIYIVIAVCGFGAGYYVEHLRFANYKQEVEYAAKAADARNKAVEQQHKLVTQGIQDEYDAKLSLLRQYYANGVRQPSSSSMPNISTTTAIANANTAYAELAANCAQTTLMLVELQKWINEQIGITNER